MTVDMYDLMPDVHIAACEATSTDGKNHCFHAADEKCEGLCRPCYQAWIDGPHEVKELRYGVNRKYRLAGMVNKDSGEYENARRLASDRSLRALGLRRDPSPRQD